MGSLVAVEDSAKRRAVHEVERQAYVAKLEDEVQDHICRLCPQGYGPPVSVLLWCIRLSLTPVAHSLSAAQHSKDMWPLGTFLSALKMVTLTEVLNSHGLADSQVQYRWNWDKVISQQVRYPPLP